MEFNYNKLKGRIIEICGTQKTFSEAMGMNQPTISHKLKNQRGWSQEDILKAVEILAIPDEEIRAYFFTKEYVNSR